MPLNAVLVTIGIFMAGVIFQLGRYSVRIEHLEAWRAEMRHALDAIHAQLSEISAELHQRTE